MKEYVSIVVEWNGGAVKGFRSKEDAERFIYRVCKKMAPDFKYSIYSIYNSNLSDRKNKIYSRTW